MAKVSIDDKLIEAPQSECVALRGEAAYWRKQTEGIEAHPHPNHAMLRAEARERKQLERHVYSFLIGLVTAAWVILVFCRYMR
jgi:hypothetical protein